MMIWEGAIETKMQLFGTQWPMQGSCDLTSSAWVDKRAGAHMSEQNSFAQTCVPLLSCQPAEEGKSQAKPLIKYYVQQNVGYPQNQDPSIFGRLRRN